MSAIPDSIGQFLQKSWKPIISNEDGAITGSKFSGTPLLQVGESWPLCSHCHQPMPLFVQLNLDLLPEPILGKYGSGLLQLFYCTNAEANCESECEAFFPYSKSTLVRIIPSIPGPVEPHKWAGNNPFPPKLIVGWQIADDYPNWEEANFLGIQLSDNESEALSQAGYPVSGDKLGGWPCWVQGIEYPNCRICGKKMRLVFQIDSEDNLPFMFGDLGCGHITQCSDHHAEVAFGWACS